MGVDFVYRWAWGTCGGKYPAIGAHKDQDCRMIVRGALNSCLVEFDDGTRFITSRNGLRRKRR